MPLLVAGLAIPTTLGLIYFVSRQIEMSVYVINIATMLGLALSIDYSLFMVSRFREELARGRTLGEAVEKAVATSGKAVAFSGFAVAIGLSGLLLFKSSAISSIGVAGSLVVIGTLVYALTFLPATLGMLGPRVNSLSLGGLFRRLGLAPERVPGRRPSLGAGRPGRHAPAAVRPRAGPRPPVRRRLTLLPPRPGRPRRLDLPARHGEPRRLHRPPDRVPDRARRRRSSSWPRSRAIRPRRQRRGPGRLRRAAGQARRDHPGREPVLADRPDDRCRPDARARSARLYALPAASRPAAGRGRDHAPSSRPTSGAAPSASTRSAGSTRLRPRRPSMSRRSGPSRPATGSRRMVGGECGDRPRLPRRPGRSDAVRDRADPDRQRGRPVPPVRLAGDPAQGRCHDPAVDQRLVRRPRLDLPGRQPQQRPAVHPAAATRSRATRSSCSA